MSLQALIVTILVPLCGSYAAWTLMPSGARRVLASWLLGFKLPRPVAAQLAKAVMPGSSCGCSGCDRVAPAAATDSARPLHFHRRSGT